MKLVIVLFILIAGTALAGERADHPFAWLAGCWISEDGSAQEAWAVEDDESLVGFAVALGEEGVSFYEMMTIRRSDDGVWVFTAYPSGQVVTSFRSTSLGDKGAVFENAAHDYPQVVRYQRSGDRLEATISLNDGSRVATFSKRACPEK